MVELKPCPFCGCKAEAPYPAMSMIFPKREPQIWTIDCSGCVVGVYDTSESGVITTWNTRVD